MRCATGPLVQALAVACVGAALILPVRPLSAAEALFDPLNNDHADRVVDVAASGDGRWIASMSSDGQLKVWDARSRRLLKTLTPHIGSGDQIAMSADGATLYSLGGSVLKRHDLKTGQVFEVSDFDWPTDFAYSERARLLVVKMGLGLKVLAADSLAVVKELHGEGFGFVVALSEDGRYLAHGAEDHAAVVLDTKTWQPVMRTAPHPHGFVELAFSHGGDRLLVTPALNPAEIWELAGARKPVILQGSGEGEIDARQRNGDKVVFQPGDMTCMGLIGKSSINIWDSRTGQRLSAFRAPVEIGTFASTSRQGPLVVGGLDGSVHLLDRIKGGVWRRLGTPRHVVESLAFLDNETFAAVTADGHVAVVDPRRNEARVAYTISSWVGDAVEISRSLDLLRKRLFSYLSLVNRQGVETLLYRQPGLYGFVAQGRYAVYSTTYELVAVTPEHGTEAVRLEWPERITALCPKGESDTVFVATAEGAVDAVTLGTQERQPILAAGGTSIESCASSGDGTRLFALYDGGQLAVVDLKTKTIERKLDTSGARQVRALGERAFLTRGGRGRSDPVRVWEPAGTSFWEVPKLTLSSSVSNRFPSTADGRAFAVIASGPTLRLLDAARRDELAMEPTLVGRVGAAAISPDGQRLVFSSFGNTVVGWDLVRHRELWRLALGDAPGPQGVKTIALTIVRPPVP
jgi:WD40 repeat protein